MICSSVPDLKLDQVHFEVIMFRVVSPVLIEATRPHKVELSLQVRHGKYQNWKEF